MLRRAAAGFRRVHLGPLPTRRSSPRSVLRPHCQLRDCVQNTGQADRHPDTSWVLGRGIDYQPASTPGTASAHGDRNRRGTWKPWSSAGGRASGPCTGSVCGWVCGIRPCPPCAVSLQDPGLSLLDWGRGRERGGHGADTPGSSGAQEVVPAEARTLRGAWAPESAAHRGPALPSRLWTPGCELHFLGTVHMYRLGVSVKLCKHSRWQKGPWPLLRPRDAGG